MRHSTRRRLPALLAAAVLAAVVSPATELAPTAAAHNESPPTAECGRFAVNPGFGDHECHTWTYHYTITSFYRRDVSGPGPGTACDYLGRCWQTASATCDHPSADHVCPRTSGSGTGWYNTNNNVRGPYGHAVVTTVTYGCASGRWHRYRGGCHAHPLTPPSDWAPYCGIWQPHNGTINPPHQPHAGGNPNPATPPHNSVDLGPCDPANPPTTPATTTTTPPTTSTTPPTTSTTPPADPVLEPGTCLAGVDSAITEDQQQAWVADTWWETLVTVGAQGEPGEPWPPHPDIPGAASWLVVSESPVWPVVDPALVETPWEAAGDDGCLWLAVGVQSRMEQLLPWQAAQRRTVEAAHLARPDAGLDTYLQRWDDLEPDRQAEVIANQSDNDFTSVACDLAVAAVSADSRAQCSWEMPVPGVWHWQALACFEVDVDGARFRDCAPLASGVAWFKRLVDYTQGITLNAPQVTDTPLRRAAHLS